jgi:hypothetical protein
MALAITLINVFLRLKVRRKIMMMIRIEENTIDRSREFVMLELK